MKSASEYPLERSWTIWEMWNTSDTSNYSSNMRAVGSFSTMWDFLQHWENLPHSTPNFYFSNFKESTERRIEGVPAPIESVGVFMTGVNPAWEDPVNAKGSDFSFRKSMEEQSLKEVWKRLVFTLIGETFPSSEDVIGVRIVDKQRNFKCEVWVGFNTEIESDKTSVFKKWMCDHFNLQNNEVLTSPHEVKSKKS
jgi:hypothetical protein